MPRFQIEVRHTYIIDAKDEDEAKVILCDIEDHGILDIDFVAYDKDIISVEEISNEWQRICKRAIWYCVPFR